MIILLGVLAVPLEASSVAPQDPRSRTDGGRSVPAGTGESSTGESSFPRSAMEPVAQDLLAGPIRFRHGRHGKASAACPTKPTAMDPPPVAPPPIEPPPVAPPPAVVPPPVVPATCQPPSPPAWSSHPPPDRRPPEQHRSWVAGFIEVFQHGVAQGVENATIRAMNNVSVHPIQPACGTSCEHVLPGTSLGESLPPPRPAATGSLGPWAPEPVAAPLEGPIIFWDHGRADFVILDPQGRRQPLDTTRHPEITVRRNLITGVTTVDSPQGISRLIDPTTIPPRGLWWNRTAKRLETTSSNGSTIEFSPNQQGFADLTDAFDLELEAGTLRTILTHRVSGVQFYFLPTN